MSTSESIQENKNIKLIEIEYTLVGLELGGIGV